MRRFQEIKGWTPGYINVAPAHIEIMVECTACGAMREFSRQTLPRHLRHALITEIEPHLKCSACSEKAAKMRFGHYTGEE